MPILICFRLLTQAVRWARLLAMLRAGSNSDVRIPMIPMTTSSSTSVNPRRFMALFPVGNAAVSVNPDLRLAIRVSLLKQNDASRVWSSHRRSQFSFGWDLPLLVIQSAGFFCQNGKDRLGDFFSLMLIASMPQRDGIHLVDVPGDQRSDRLFGIFLDIFSQQSGVIQFLHLPLNAADGEEVTGLFTIVTSASDMNPVQADGTGGTKGFGTFAEAAMTNSPVTSAELRTPGPIRHLGSASS